MTRPSPALAPYVHCYWILRGAAGQEPQTIFPDGRMEMVFQLSDPFAAVEHGRLEIQSSCLLVGQMRSPSTIVPTGRVHSFGIRFQPAGACAFLPFPLDHVAAQILPLDQVLGNFARDFAARLADAADPVAVAEQVLLSRLLDRGVAPVTRFALRGIARCGGQVRVHDIASDAGISRRQFERLFRQQVGIAPKVFSRIVRFQRVLRAPLQDWAITALDCGYFDQAHLIRDFRDFTGQTPSAWRKQQVAFLQDSEPLAG